jgi:hypothetical protein
MALNPQGFARLKSQLLNTGLSQKDHPLYQVINQLIDNLQDTANELAAATGSSSGGGGLAAASYYTKDIEGALPNSRQLLPGQGIEFQHSPNGRTVIHTALPLMIDNNEESEIGLMGPPGIQGPRGATSSPASAPYWFEESNENIELFPLISLNNPGLIPEAALHNDNLLARVADTETISGAWTFTAGITTFDANTPQAVWRDSGGGSNEKYWRFLIFSGTRFIIQVLDDSFAGASSVMDWVRTGATPLYTRNFAGVVNQSLVSVSLTADQTAWNPTGLGSTFYFSVTPTAAWVIKGIVAQTAGMIITIVNMSNFALQFNHEDAGATAANRIYAPLSSNFTINQYQVVSFFYDSILSRWMKLSWS